LHADEIPIDLPLVRALVDASFPDLAPLPLRPLDATGSTNALFRLGDDLLVRLPRQPGGSATIDKEVRWLPVVGPPLPVVVPEVVAVGRPGFGYDERWSLVRWLEGRHPAPADRDPPDEPARTELASDLAGVVRALRRVPVPPEALADPGLRWYRGEPVTVLADEIRGAIDRSRRIPGLDLDLEAVSAVWDDAMSAAGPTRQCPEPRWLHGDLVAENLLVTDHGLSAVLDFGALSVGDPTVDLTAAWELLDPTARATFRDLVDVDDSTWEQARAWALAMGMMTFPYYWDTMPARCANRLAMIRSVLADFGHGAGSASSTP
jgi:aminoglycoside phosphotransferase (APT) family kinase protein